MTARDPLLLTAIAAGKATRAGLQLLGRGATALPGLVTLAVDPDAIARLSVSLAHGAVCVSGTNGKTTTTRMLSDIVRTAGWQPVHNRSGSNLDRGIAAALLADATWGGELRGDVGVFEIDEASVPRMLARLTPRVVVITNLFRDQLDRYFEIDALARRIGEAVAKLPEATTLVLNADDPIVAYLGSARRGSLLTFGVDDLSVGGTVPQTISDATRCPRCKSPLRYSRVILAHVGDWRCDHCGLSRPRPDVSAAAVHLGPNETRIRLGGSIGSAMDDVVVPLPGLYNAYNALAALAAARALDIALPTAMRALASFKPAFGRLEIVEAEGRRLRLVLVKNPAGFNAAIGALLETGRHPRILGALNDRDADSRDVSWIWDADFEALAPRITHATVTGLRARDLALRFKYAGVPRDRVTVVDGWVPAIRAAIDGTPAGDELVVLATYTAMLSLRDALSRLGFVGQFWED
ncbi:MAG: MurT ligase domain-containing protein [Chloroflexota bacterium]|nr:MurT ligase domain-containing protein [Chloroflexota bacterium]